MQTDLRADLTSDSPENAASINTSMLLKEENQEESRIQQPAGLNLNPSFLQDLDLEDLDLDAITQMNASSLDALSDFDMAALEKNANEIFQKV